MLPTCLIFTRLQGVLLFTFVYLFSGQLCSAESRYGYEYISDANGWLRLHTVPSTWANARLQCQLEGGILASPTSNVLSTAMMKMMGEKSQNLNMVYTGINALIAKADYMTIDGLPLSNIYLDWGAWEPNNKDSSEACLVMTKAGKLADVNCWHVYGYFCFKKSAKMSMSNCGTWDDEYQLDPRTGSCYKFHTVPRTWHHAALTCRAEQAHLAVINNDTEAVVLQELFAKHLPEKYSTKKDDFAFLGFWDWSKQDDWRTIFGETFAEAGFGRWEKSQPDRLGDEFCGAMDSSQQLHDVSCDTRHAFICEIIPEGEN